MSDEVWDFESIMKIIEREVDAKERSVGNLSVPTRRVLGRTPPTVVSLMANTSMKINCVYRNQYHPSILCKAVTTPEMRKQALPKVVAVLYVSSDTIAAEIVHRPLIVLIAINFFSTS